MSTSHPFDMDLGVSYYPDYVADFLAAEAPLNVPPSALTISTLAPENPEPESSKAEPFQAADIQISEIEDRIRQDLDAMVALGLTIIRMGEFSWSAVEPEPQRFTPEIFLFTLDEAHRRALKVIFCTPTATPPEWLIQKHPEILPVDREGRIISSGSRRHYNLASEIYRDHAKRIAHYYGTIFGKHHAVLGFQIDNEFGCHGSSFQFNPEIRTGFQTWLRRRYRSIDDLNLLWFGSFWSGRFNDFAQIGLPEHTYSDNNPHLELEFRRYLSQLTADFQKIQIDEIRSSCGKWCTHNFMSLFTDLDHWKISHDLDYAGFDHYQMKPFPDFADSMFQFSLMRSLRPDRPFLLLEQQPLQVNWQDVNRRIPYHLLFVWTMQAFFQGAGAVLYFSWQRFRGGAERMHDGVLSHEGLGFENWQRRLIRATNIVKADLKRRPGSYKAPPAEASSPGLTAPANHETFSEPSSFPRKSSSDGKANPVQSSDQSVHRKGAIQTDQNPSQPFHPEVIVFLDYNALWAHNICHQSSDFQLLEILRRLTLILNELGWSFAFCSRPTDVPREFRSAILWIFPGMTFAEDIQHPACQSFQKRGGMILSLASSGVMDGLGRMVPSALQYLHPDLRLADFGALGPEEVEHLISGKRKLLGSLWAESICGSGPDGSAEQDLPEDMVCIAEFQNGLYDKKPAIIGRKTDEGGWIHIATVPHLPDQHSVESWSLALTDAFHFLDWHGLIPAWPGSESGRAVDRVSAAIESDSDASKFLASSNEERTAAFRTREANNDLPRLIQISSPIPFPGGRAFLNPQSYPVQLAEYKCQGFSHAIKYWLNDLQPEIEEIRIPKGAQRPQSVELEPGAILVLIPEG